jgi:hypothetical protein
MRRFVANLIDLIICSLVLSAYLLVKGKNFNDIMIDYNSYIAFCVITFIYYIFIPIIGLYQTTGYSIARLYLKDYRFINPRNIKFSNFIIRQLLNFWSIPIAYLLHIILLSKENQIITNITFMTIIFFTTTAFINLLTYILVFLKIRNQTLNDQIQGIKVVKFKKKEG